jgi:hypothetical protein
MDVKNGILTRHCSQCYSVLTTAALSPLRLNEDFTANSVYNYYALLYQ